MTVNRQLTRARILMFDSSLLTYEAMLRKHRLFHQGHTMPSASFTLRASLVVQFRGKPIALEALSIGLLMTCPNPEGDRAVEFEAEGYSRAPISFPAPDGKLEVRSSGKIVFGPFGAETEWPRYAAIFNGEGILIAYGLLERSAGHPSANCFEFAPTAVRLKL